MSVQEASRASLTPRPFRSPSCCTVSTPLFLPLDRQAYNLQYLLYAHTRRRFTQVGRQQSGNLPNQDTPEIPGGFFRCHCLSPRAFVHALHACTRKPGTHPGRAAAVWSPSKTPRQLKKNAAQQRPAEELATSSTLRMRAPSSSLDEIEGPPDNTKYCWDTPEETPPGAGCPFETRVRVLRQG